MKSITIPDQAIPYAFERRETPIRTKSKETICSYDQLPVALNADQVAAVLGISRSYVSRMEKRALEMMREGLETESG